MKCMSIDETFKKVMRYYPTRPFMTRNVLGLYEADGYDITDIRVITIVSKHLATLYKQNYLKVVNTTGTGRARRVYMVRR